MGRSPWSELYPLLHDDIALSNKKTALTTGYCVAVLTAIVLYISGSLYSFTLQQGMYAVVSVSLTAALLAFSFLELRAPSDA
jgi:uncharacterized membrane-anchored protein YitT (DUF2179 family)